MCAARVVGGIGVGHLNTIIPIWSSEVADAKSRGAFIAFEFFLGVGGATFAFWFEYALALTNNPLLAWRFPIAFQVVFLVIVLVAINFFPESPRWLAKMGRYDQARDVLSRCRVDASPTKIDEELEQIKHVIQIEHSSVVSHSYWRMLVSRDSMNTRRRVILAIGVQLMQKFTGIDFITTYAPQIFGLAGYKGNVPTLLAGGDFIAYTFSLLLAVYLIDRVGRRKVMIWGAALMGITLSVAGVLDYFVLQYDIVDGPHPDARLAQIYGTITAGFIYLYTCIFGSTWITAGWLYPTEIFPVATRAKGSAWSSFAFAIGNAAVVMCVPYLIQTVTFYIFIIFAVCNFLIIPIVYLFYPETANRSLEELDVLFTSKSVLVHKAEEEYKQGLLYDYNHHRHRHGDANDDVDDDDTSILSPNNNTIDARNIQDP
eukprot:TRINITY_DN12721_c0_g1_i1.p1 TRINITY_DN12721_c0_g1~~TRINITY_DN12721_c0_g1_i1.p1  ORF type:complete len:429 (-),score=66.28 TRINITY_DN12721_c0_g1_i1:29-1315(-)